MAVAFDAVSSATPTAGTTSPHTWTHTGVGSSLAVVAAICLDEATSGTTVACTYGGVSMTLIGQSAANNANNGILYFFGIANAPTGAQTVSFTFSGTTDVCVGASVSWTGAATTFGGAFGNLQPVPVTGGEGLAANPALSITCHSTNSQAFCVIASGASAITSMGGGAQRFLSAQSSSGDCGSIVGSNATGINGNINFTSVIASGSYAIAGLEILPPAAPLAYPPAEAPGLKAPSAFRFRRPFFVLPPAGNPKFSTFIDQFQTNDLSVLWGASVGTCVWSQGQVAIQVDTGYSSQLINTTANVYDLTSSAIYIRVNPYVQGSSATTLNLTSGAGQNGFFCGQSGGNFTVYKIIAGVQTNLSNTTWNAATMAWWQITESGGTVSFQYAADSSGSPGAWTTAFSTADSTFTGTVLTGMNAAIVCGDFGSDPVGISYIYAVNTSVGSVSFTAKPTAALSTGTAYNVNPGVGPNPPTAQATGTAYNPALTVKPTVTAAMGTGTGYNPAVNVAFIATLASGTGSAQSPPPGVGPSPTAATATGTAYNAMAGSSGTTATPTAATATATAYNALPGVGPNPPAATATGTAYNAGSVNLVVIPNTATATGTAYNPAPTIKPTASAATATGTAYNPALTAGEGVSSALATGTAYNPVVNVVFSITAATATGTAYPALPGVGSKPTAALAAGTANNTASVNLTATIMAAIATGTAYNLSTVLGVPAAPATGTGTAYSVPPGVGPSPATASATGTAYNPVLAITVIPITATATGTAYSPALTIAVIPITATATGTAYSASIPSGSPTAVTATGTGTAYNPGTGVGPNAPAATGTGTAYIPTVNLIVVPSTASATGTAYNPALTAKPTITAATATGTAYNPALTARPTASAATATGTAYNPALTAKPTITAATATGTAYNPALTAKPTITAATATGTAYNLTYVLPPRQPLALGGTIQTVDTYGGSAATVANNYGGTVTPATIDAQLTLLNYGGTVQTVDTLGGTAVTVANNYGGTCTLLNYGGGITLLSYGGTVTPVTIDGSASTVANNYGGTVTPVTIDAQLTLLNYGGTVQTVDTLGGTVSSLSGSYGGTVGVVTYDASLVGWTMQVVALTLAENNDETVNVAITSSGSALNLTGATINMYLKTAAGTADGSALLLSSAGGSPAITITSTSGGLCTVAIPRADLTAETNNFYRIDVVFSGLQNTAIYGAITWITL